MKSLCVFISSRNSQNPNHAQAARQLGEAIAAQGLRLVYGGGSVGLMRELANAALKKGGEVVGVIPQSLVDSERVHPRLSHAHVVQSLAERKAKMEELSDAFVALPGGLGTFNELLEMLTWRQLGLHQKPVAVLNVDNYFEPFLSLLSKTREAEFLSPEDEKLLTVAGDIQSVLGLL